MTLTQLKYVLALSRFQNFTLAAQKCAVTQPTLSMQIQKLEDELQLQIFDRSKKPIQVTHQGRQIIEQARAVLEQSEKIKDIADREKGFVGGKFKLGIIPTVMPTLLPMFLKNFTRRYPKVFLVIKELNTEQLIAQLMDGTLDAAIAATPLENEKIKEKILYYEPFVPYVPLNHRLYSEKKIKATTLDVNEVLLLKDGHCFRTGVINLCTAGLDYREDGFALESGNFETLIKLADENLGMTLLPWLHSNDLPEEQKKNLREFEAPQPAREVSMVYNKNELRLHIIEALYDSIMGVVRGAIHFQNVQIVSPLPKRSQ